MKVFIVANISIEGFHQWEGCNIESESYLKNEHRHVFYIECKKEVTNDDRQIEIISFKNDIIDYLHKTYGKRCCFGNMSCEMIARQLCKAFYLNSCKVLEDNENGAIVEL